MCVSHPQRLCGTGPSQTSRMVQATKQIAAHQPVAFNTHKEPAVYTASRAHVKLVRSLPEGPKPPAVAARAGELWRLLVRGNIQSGPPLPRPAPAPHPPHNCMPCIYSVHLHCSLPFLLHSHSPGPLTTILILKMAASIPFHSECADMSTLRSSPSYCQVCTAAFGGFVCIA